MGSASFRTNVTNSGLIFDGYSPSGSLEVSRIYTDATSGTPSDFVLGTYPNAHSNQLYLKQSNGFVGIKTANPTTALDVNGTVTATSFIKRNGLSTEYLMADGSVSNGSSTTVGAINSTSDPKGATITAGELKLAPADATNGGIVTTGTQTFGGSKTFNSNVIGNLSGNATTATNIAGGSLGQIPYQNSSNTTSFLPADTSTSRKFLSSIGSNGNATAPTWQPIRPSDIISSSSSVSGNLNFETSIFGSQSWTELDTQWNITQGWANLRDYNGTAYQGSYSINAPDSQDFTLQSSKDFNLTSLFIMGGGMNTATSIEFKGYTAAGVLVGSVIVNTSAFNFNFSNVNLNFSGIRKLVFHPIGFDPNAMGGGSFFLDYFSVTFATSNNLSSVNGILKSNGNGEITAAVSGTDFLAPTGSAAGLTNFPTLNQNTTGTAANVSGVVAIANGGTAATTAAEALTNLGAAPINSPNLSGTPTAPTATPGTNTTQIATTAFIQDLLLNAPTSSSSTLSGAIWTSATTGTLNGIGFTVGSYTMSSDPPSLLNSNYSTADYASNPLSATQETSYFMSGSSWTVTFNSPISNLKLYVYWRASGIGGSSFYRFDQAFSIASGSTGMTNSGNDLNISGWGKGILEFSGPITTLTLSADGTSCCSGHTMTFASGVGGIASASGTGQVIRIDSPNLEGIPTAPTAAPGTNTTQIATTAFVMNALSTATSNGGSTTLGSISTSSNQNGATLIEGELKLAPADATNGGIVTTEIQTFAGAKTFSSDAAQTNVPDINLIVSKTAYNIENTNNFLSVETVIDPFVYSSQGVIIRKDDGAKRGFKLGQEGSYDGDSVFKIASFSDSPDINRFVIRRDNGNIGIGNSSPTEKLEVTGNLKTSGAITASGFNTPTGTSSQYLMADGSVSNGSSTTVGAINSTSDPKGATITAGELKLAPADASNGGIVTTGTQTFAGAKTFSDGLRIENKPFLPTKLNQSQINSLTGVEEGMVIYNTDTRKLQIFSVGNTDTTNELYSGNFSSERGFITQSFVPQVSGSVYAFQFFAKKVINNNGPSFVTPDLSVFYPGGDTYVDLPSLTTSGEWISITLPTPISVVAGNSYNFSVDSYSLCLGKLILGTNSNYSNGSIINSFSGCENPGALNGADLMFRVLITPSSTSAYWLNLN